MTIRYEDLLTNEGTTFEALFKFYGFSWVRRCVGVHAARKLSASNQDSRPHIRDPSTGQWKKHFTPRIKRYFDERYGDLVERLGYAS